MKIANFLEESMSGMLLVTAQVENETSNEVWEGWGSVIMVAGSVLLVVIAVAVIVGIVVYQSFKTKQQTIESRAQIAQEEAYRKLAEEATSVQNRTAAELHQLTEGMADLRVRVTTIERMLREVE